MIYKWESKMNKCPIPKCDDCDVKLQPVYFKEIDEFGTEHIKCDYLICPICLRKIIVDDSFDLS